MFGEVEDGDAEGMQSGISGAGGLFGKLCLIFKEDIGV